MCLNIGLIKLVWGMGFNISLFIFIKDVDKIKIKFFFLFNLCRVIDCYICWVIVFFKSN